MGKKKTFSISYGSDEYELELNVKTGETGEVNINASLKTTEQFLKDIFKGISEAIGRSLSNFPEGVETEIIPPEVKELLEALKSAAETVKQRLEKNKK
ncbi:hypothetical protein DRP04_05060 [Archaeoglobales archaeon]|nr:MAG: hypothetical protein DRP04_05060 [Archaeoglobales archaeon]